MQRSDDPGQTNFMVASTTFTQGPKRITLSGDFSFDAISNDGKRLYLVEGLALSRPGYQVRLYDIDAGSLDPRIVVDKRETGPMAGTRVSGVFDPRGQWQYSLYVNEAKGPFIHALSLDGNLAWCIDLPAAGKRIEQMMWSLTLNAEGTALIAVNPALGKVARVDIGPEGPANEVSESIVFTPPVRQPAQAQGLDHRRPGQGHPGGFLRPRS